MSRNICCQARDTFVYVFEGLQVRKMNHRKERLLERLTDSSGCINDLLKTIFYQRRHLERVID